MNGPLMLFSGHVRSFRFASARGSRHGAVLAASTAMAPAPTWLSTAAVRSRSPARAVASIVQQADAARAEISGSSQAGPVAKAMMKAALPS
ncbi:hypothetical protein [Streptomyces sioyaensis]|uniref:hypothetical protein n=1 Tax=Streptomyces sioyaensis TaxID=67364 RepID=UPI0037B43BE8